MSNPHICFIGGGNMARSLIGGLIDDGMKPQFITVGEPDASRREELTNDFGVTVLADNVAAVNKSDIVIFAVKPQVMKLLFCHSQKCCPRKTFAHFDCGRYTYLES